MPRLFTGLRLPAEAAQMLALKRGGLAGARWIEPDDYHITLSFVGDVDHVTAREIEHALDDLPLQGPIDLMLDRLDCFGGDKPRSVFAHVSVDEPVLPGIEGVGDPLQSLKAMSDGAMRRVGVAYDTRRFIPHVTVARLKQTSASQVADYLGQAALAPVRFKADALVLLSSRDSRGGGPYRVERQWALEDIWSDLDDEWADEEWDHDPVRAPALWT